MRKPKLVYENDGRHYLTYRYDPPMTLYQFQQPVDEILGTGVDTMFFGLVSRNRTPEDRKVGLRWDWATGRNNQVMFWRAGENLKRAIKVGVDPLEIVVNRAREKGIQVLLPLLWEPAEGAVTPDTPCVESGADYARPEVRRERLDMTEEVCERYAVDGIVMTEFTRALTPSVNGKHASDVTDFIKEVRGLLDRIGDKKGGRVGLAAQVFAVESANVAVGMDVKTWLSEGLIDLVVPLAGLPLLDTNPPPIRWLTEAAHRAGAWVYSPVGNDSEGRSVLERFDEDRARMRPLPGAEFDARKVVAVSVRSTAMVKVEGAWHSVPSHWARLEATAYVGVDEVSIVCRGQEVTHPRQGFGGRRVNYRHYLPELARKPQAVRQVAPELVAELGEPYGRLWQVLVETYGAQDGARVLSRVIGAVAEQGVEAVGDALERALEAGSRSPIELAPPPLRRVSTVVSAPPSPSCL